jgi:ATP phosphoribosyltransferase regulatory subunit HisZ
MSLKLLAIEPIVLSLGNVAVFDALIAQEALNDEQASALRQIFVKRSVPDLARTMRLNHCNDRLVPKPWNNLHYKHRTQHLYGIRKP